MKGVWGGDRNRASGNRSRGSGRAGIGVGDPNRDSGKEVGGGDPNRASGSWRSWQDPVTVGPYGLWVDWQESSGAAASGSWQASSSWQENSGAASSSWQESSGAAGDGGEDPNTPSNQLYYKARQWGGSDKDGRGRLRSEAPWYKPNWVPGITHGEGGYAALDGVWIPAGRAIHCADPGL